MPVSIDAIARATCNIIAIPPSRLTGRRCLKSCAARAVITCISVDIGRCSHNDVGKWFGVGHGSALSHHKYYERYKGRVVPGVGLTIRQVADAVCMALVSCKYEGMPVPLFSTHMRSAGYMVSDIYKDKGSIFFVYRGVRYALPLDTPVELCPRIFANRLRQRRQSLQGAKHGSTRNNRQSTRYKKRQGIPCGADSG